MSKFVVYTRTEEEIVEADRWEIVNNKVYFQLVFDSIKRNVAVFNMDVIDGFKEKL